MRRFVPVGFVVAVLVGASAPAAGAADTRTAFIKSCVSQMYYAQAVCACMADKAPGAIGEEGMAYEALGALDVAHSTAMSKSMSASERNRIDAFMKTAPHQCAAAK